MVYKVILLVIFFTLALPLHARRMRYTRKELSRDLSTKYKQTLADNRKEIQNKWPTLSEDLASQSLVERAHNSTNSDTQEPLTISAIIGIVMAVVSIVTTIWDLWEKWNAIIMLKYAMSEMKNSDWSKLQKYKKYSEISFCMSDRVDEAVDTMNVVATYYQLLHYAETQCSRPDVHLDWLSTSKRCTRDFAAERVAEMHTEICSAQYGEGLFSTVEMLQDDSLVKPSMDGCTCLENYLCAGKNWCHVAEDSTCPDKDWTIKSGYYSFIPCEVKGMVDEDKARMLLKSTCTVCHHGFFRNAGLIENDVYAGVLDPSLQGKDIKDERIREAVKLRYKNYTMTTSQKAQDLNMIDDDVLITVEGKTYMEIMKWERLMEFDKKCNEFKASLSINERTQMTGEDLANEKIARLVVDGRLGKLGTNMQWQADKVGDAFAKKGADAFESAEAEQTSLLQLEGLREVHGSTKRLQARRTKYNSKGPNLEMCSDYKILSQNADILKKTALESSEIMAASECSAVEGAISRKSAWRRLGVSCKCEAYSTNVYCGQEQIAGRKWNLAEVAEKECSTRLYCSRFPRTQEQVNFLVKARLGCSVIPGAKDKTMNSSPECKCANKIHMLFCGESNYGRGTYFHLYDDVLNHRACLENARCAEPEYWASLAKVNTANRENDACREVFGAQPREFILAGYFGSYDCKCGKDESLFCGLHKTRGRKFNKLMVLQEGCSDFLYCSKEAKSDSKILDMMRTTAKPIKKQIRRTNHERNIARSASLIQLRSSTEGGADVLLWVPLQLARVLKVTTQGVVDWGMAIWWLGFNNLYGAYGTMEAFGVLAKATHLWDKFIQWTGIITFFIWLINDAIFVGLNTAMCPKIADWIEIMDGVRAERGAQGNKGNKTGVALDQDVYGTKSFSVNASKKKNRQWCNTKLEDVNYELQKELIERTIVLRQVVEFQQETISEIPDLGDPSEVLEFLETDPNELEKQVEGLSWTEGDDAVGLKLSQTHEKVTKFLRERLSPDAICPVADRVMQFKWTDNPKLSRIHKRRLQDNVCRCDPRPQECGEGEREVHEAYQEDSVDRRYIR